MFDVDNNDFLNWTDYYADMSDTNMYKDLTKQDYAMKNGDEIGAVPYVMERYGIIYNKALLQKYFDANWSSVKDVETINNFDTLRTVADEIQAHKDDLGINRRPVSSWTTSCKTMMHASWSPTRWDSRHRSSHMQKTDTRPRIQFIAPTTPTQSRAITIS